MTTDVRPPSERAQDEDDGWHFDTTQFEEGPDNWNENTREGWRLYYVENIPYRGIYALCKYSWKTDRQDVVVDVGTVETEPMISLESVNDVFHEHDVEELTENQYKVVHSAYKDCLSETLRNATLSKGFQICDHTMYFQVDEFPKYLMGKIESLNDEINRIQGLVEEDDVPEYMSEDKVEEYTAMSTVNQDQLDNLQLITEAVERPHEEGVEFAQYCQFVGELSFNQLEPFQLRAIELVHNGVFHNNQAVAVVQALREEDYSQREIADKLGKDESTVSKQVSVANSLTQRSRWHSANVTLDGRE